MLNPSRPFFISPPFGTWFREPHAYSVLGSFTVLPRPGRLGQILRTVRPAPFTNAQGERGPAWINKIGLRNPGIASVNPVEIVRAGKDDDIIISLAPLDNRDWHAFERWIDEEGADYSLFEFNVSCPNVNEHPDLPATEMLSRIIHNYPDTIFKLPPVEKSVEAVKRLTEAGVRYVHLSNTLPSPIGGISGAPLREVNLPLVEAVCDWEAMNEVDITVIAGGGNYEQEHINQYRDAGATKFAVGSAFFWPPRGKRLINGD